MFCQFVHKTKLIRRLFILNVQSLQSKPNPLISTYSSCPKDKKMRPSREDLFRKK